MTDREKFHLTVGESVMNCQRVEYDVKLLCAALLPGGVEKNLDGVKDKTLGGALAELETLDGALPRPYFTAEDFAMLRGIKEVRNWLAHACYADFMYDRGAVQEENFRKAYRSLRLFHAELRFLAGKMEEVRKLVLHEVGETD